MADKKPFKKFFSLQWHVTNACDQRCKHCYIWQNPEQQRITTEPDIEQCQYIIKQFDAFTRSLGAIPHFVITGGDPLLYSHFWQLLKILREYVDGFIILGNPFHLTPKITERLKQLGCTAYQMSIDGLEETHDRFRNKGSFNATWHAIPLLQKADIRTLIMSTASLENYKEIPAVIQLCHERKVTNFTFARYCPTDGNGTSNIPPYEYRKFLEEVWRVFEANADSGTRFSLKDHLWTALLYEKGLLKLHERKGTIFGGCNCGLRHMSLLPDGTIYACRRFKSPVGNIYTDTFAEAFFSPQMETYREIERLEGCKDCELLYYCRGCHAVAAGTTGDFFASGILLSV